MSYKILLKEEVEDDLNKLTKAQKILVFKQFKKLENSPQLGVKLVPFTLSNPNFNELSLL